MGRNAFRKERVPGTRSFSGNDERGARSKFLGGTICGTPFRFYQHPTVPVPFNFFSIFGFIGYKYGFSSKNHIKDVLNKYNAARGGLS